MSSSSIKHVAIIMDGNGRWANERSRPRVFGHIRGSAIVSKIVEEADNMGVEALTLYAFSTENWSRPVTEIKVLFKLLKKFLLKERAKILKNQIKFKVIGDISGLPDDTVQIIKQLEQETAEHKGLILSFAFGYGGRDEIVHAVNKFIKENPGQLIDNQTLTNNLFTESSEVDLLIRTGGDQRISNFLLWQMAYAELHFTPIKWPDFTPEMFREIVECVSNRERRFGGLGIDCTLEKSSEKANINKKALVE